MPSLWNIFRSPHTQSPYHQLWVLDGGFGMDAFAYYGSWLEDNSIIYRITTHTSWIAKAASLLTPIKANTVFLKIQVPSHREAYELLEKHADTSMVPPEEFKEGAQNLNFLTAFPLWSTVSGESIREFVKKNEKNIQVEKREYSAIRVYVIVWAPNGERRRLEGMDSFIEKVWGGELGFDRWMKLFGAVSNVVKGGSPPPSS